MSSAVTDLETDVRPLQTGELEQIIAIDSGHVGESRRRFFEKRLAHAKQQPDDFVHVGAHRGGVLVGFAFARFLRGEFGRDQTVAILDAVSVARNSRERGVGRALMDGLTEIMRRKGVHSLQSQADWTNHALLRFFDASGFRLAPRLMLERSVLTPLAEPDEDD